MDQIARSFIWPGRFDMGSVGKTFEKVGQGIGTFLGVNQPTKMGAGGAFAVTPEAAAAEQETLQRLRDRAAGKGPSITELQYKQSLDDLMKAQQSSVASARGASNPMLLQRQAMLAGQQAQLDTAREIAMAKLAEQRAAEQSILQQAAAQRGVAMQSAASELGAVQKAGETRAGFFGAVGASGAKLMAGGGGGGGAAAGSDENMKKNIEKSEKSGNELVEDFLNALKSYTYEYKEKEVNGKKTPEGEVTSVMAQDLEKSDLGKKMVHDTPEGKMVDYAQGMAPLFAAIAELNQRTKKLEKKG